MHRRTAASFIAAQRLPWRAPQMGARAGGCGKPMLELRAGRRLTFVLRERHTACGA